MKGGFLKVNKLNKLGAAKKTSPMVWIFGVAALILLTIIAVGIFGGKQEQKTIGEETTIPGGTSVTTQCPSDYGFSGTVTVQNDLNLTGAETFDTTTYFYSVDANGNEVFEKSATDTTAGTLTLSCGTTYVARVLSVDGAAGDNSVIESASMSGATSLGAVSNGGWKFVVTKDAGALTFKVHQHGLIQLRAFDIENNNYLYNTTATSATAYVTSTSANFTSITANSTATAVGTSGSYNVRLEIQTQNADESFQDQGVYILVDAATNKWSKPTLKVDGATLTDMKGTLPVDEAKAYANYEYVYKTTSNFINPDKISVEYLSTAVNGVDPAGSDAPVIALAPIGSYVSVSDSNLLKVGSVKDDSSQTAVYTLYTINFFIS
jgi:hypothetical protein